MRISSNTLIAFLVGLIFTAVCNPSIAESLQVIPVHKLNFVPTLDGNDSEWSGVPAETVALNVLAENSIVEATEVSVKAAYDDEYIYFCFEWIDSEQNTVHKPFVWDDQKNKYLPGPQREDRLALQLAMNGEFTADWRKGGDFVADMWHWKSARSNPVGLVHDKILTVSSTTRLLRAAEIAGHSGPVFIKRSSDSGDSIYTTRRYKQKAEAVMPKYILNNNPAGSIADIKAAGVWLNGKWRLELRRKLNTGNDDDAVFLPGQAIKGAISVFDGSENHDHNYSSTLIFQL